MERRDFLKATSVGALGALMPSAAKARPITPEAGVRPNIVFIVSDQHRAGLTKRSGCPIDTSPTFDKLSEAGISFDHAYATCPLCVPSRISMLTGRWPEAHRVRMNLAAKDAFFEKDLYQVAKEMGYRTGLAGKNHTYLKEGDLDFWREYRYVGGKGWMPPNAPPVYKEYQQWQRGLDANVALSPTPFPLEVQFPYRIVSDAIEFMNQGGTQPFILQIGFSQPHDPEQVPKPYWDMYSPDQVPDRCAGPEVLPKFGYRAQWLYGYANSRFPTEKHWRRYKSNYLGMLRLLDDQLTRLVDHMRQNSLLQNTILIYLADHGDYLMDYGLARKGVGLFECLTRIPMVWSGYGIRPSAIGSTAFASMADVMPTLCEAMGAEIPHGVQGRSLWPLLQGQAYPQEEFRSIYSEAGLGGLYYDSTDGVQYSSTVEPGTPQSSPAMMSQSPTPPGQGWDELNKVTQSGIEKMVRMGDWKLIYDMMGYGQLYHLASDPCELTNLFGQPSAAQDQARLMEELLMWTIRSQDSLPTGPQSRHYQTKWSRKHNWYTPYRDGSAPEAFIA